MPEDIKKLLVEIFTISSHILFLIDNLFHRNIYILIVKKSRYNRIENNRQIYFISDNMGSKIEYVESSHMYATNYIRNSKAIGVLWGIFTICYAIIGVVAFVTPEWLGDLEHENPGRFGLWTRCSYGGNGKLIFSQYQISLLYFS